jgi:uncharacterized protein (TIGR02265 family)
MIQSNAAAAPSASNGEEITDYDRRIPLANPKDTLRGLYFNGVFNAVKKVGGEQALRQCHELMGDPKLSRRYIDFSSYPVVDFLKVASAGARVIAPHVGGQANALRQIGMQSVSDFFNSMVGKTLLLLSGTSPARALSNLPQGYSTSVTYGERQVTLLGENSARVSFRSDLMPPAHNEGVLMCIMQVLKAKNPQVRTYPKGMLDCDHEVSWE